jgi:hypothetical protein
MTKETEAKWVERVREWRASGLSAEEFAASRGFKASTLSWAASLLRDATSPPAPAAASSKPKSQPRARRKAGSRKAPRFLPVRTRATAAATTEMVVEIGAVRVRVSRGFDASLLGDLVRALGGSSR